VKSLRPTRRRYLYRAIDRSGALVDVMFSEHRDMAAAKAFFESAKMVTDVTPDRVTTDGHDSYPRDPDHPGCRCAASRQPISQ
jgi:transposase-like protein